jgi:hypothetical protein
VVVQPIKYNQTEPHPYLACNGPIANKPMEAVMLPVPFIKPVTVPNDLLLPRTEGCEAKSAATADVIILLGLLAMSKIIIERAKTMIGLVLSRKKKQVCSENSPSNKDTHASKHR